jgi:hypothetical protein
VRDEAFPESCCDLQVSDSRRVTVRHLDPVQIYLLRLRNRAIGHQQQSIRQARVEALEREAVAEAFTTDGKSGPELVCST